MKLGALLGPITEAGKAGALADQARMYAGEGFASLWSAQSIGRGFMLTDPFIALTVAATAAEHVEIGSAIIQVPLYHPMDLAHRVHSLHQVCGERLILGVGAGSTEADFAMLGRHYAGRFRAFGESVAALRETYEPGTDAHSVLSPWPAMNRPPPLLLGSWGAGVERAAKDFDGWIASAHYRTVGEVIDAARRYDSAGGGRKIVSTIVLDKDADLGALKEKLARFKDAGFDDAVVMIYPGGPSAAAVRALVD